MATVADYPDARQRILDAEVDAEAVTRDEVLQQLRASGSPQITEEVAQDLSDAVLTRERVLEAVETSGDIPTAGELGSFVDALDADGREARRQAVESDVTSRVVTRDDVEVAVNQRDPTFRDEVEAAVDDAGSGKEFVGASRDEVTAEFAREASAPERSQFVGAVAREASEQVRVEETVDEPPRRASGDPKTGDVTVVRDTSGDPVAVLGSGADAEATEAVAEEFGASTLGGVEELQTETEVVPSAEEGRADLVLRGRKIGEVDL